MKKTITLRDGEDFYAKVFVLCHESNISAGRSINLAKSDEVSVLFEIKTPHGLLEVLVLREHWIPILGYSVSMRFKDCPDFYPYVDGTQYDKSNGKWGFPCYVDGDPTGMLDNLAERLEWAQESAVELKSA